MSKQQVDADEEQPLVPSQAFRHPEDRDGPSTRARGPVLGYVVIGALCVAGLGAIYLGVRPASSASSSSSSPIPATANLVPEDPPSKHVELASALVIEDTKIGNGAAPAKAGDKLRVHYTGRLASTGAEFDASRPRGDEGFKFDLGKGMVIKGWDQGLVGMRVGGKRTLTIPAHLAYGPRGVGDKIPPNSALVFDVDLLEITRDGKALTEKGSPTTSDPHAGDYSLEEATRDLPGNGRIVADIKTSKGLVSCTLLEQKAPNTVANFIGLATGKRTFKDPTTEKWVNRPAYDNTTFHRVIKGFMIQGGDPLGTGRGEPGYVFKDENWEGAKHDRAGLLCMANRGHDTNGAQFFITDDGANHLDGNYTIFGSCVGAESVAVVHSIAATPVNGEKPVTPVQIERVTIRRAL
jgi:peptidyl-prolyl cis-trans isomerase A (cyclophilin A)